MTYIFMDESGDLGFRIGKRKGTDHFLVAFLILQGKERLEKVLKRMYQKLTRRKHARSKSGAFHAAHEEPQTVRSILREISSSYDFKIFYSIIEKSRIPLVMQNDKHALYVHMIEHLLDSILKKEAPFYDKEIVFVVSQRETSRYLNERFKNQISAEFKNKYGIGIEVRIRKPHEEKCLQLVDIISWSIFQHYENSEGSFYEMIRSYISGRILNFFHK